MLNLNLSVPQVFARPNLAERVMLALCFDSRMYICEAPYDFRDGRIHFPSVHSEESMANKSRYDANGKQFSLASRHPVTMQLQNLRTGLVIERVVCIAAQFPLES